MSLILLPSLGSELDIINSNYPETEILIDISALLFETKYEILLY